jgi:hypothetical protein
MSEISGLKKVPATSMTGGGGAMTKDGGFSKLNVYSVTKAGDDVTKGGGSEESNVNPMTKTREIDDGPCHTTGDLEAPHVRSVPMLPDDETKDIQRFNALVKKWRQEKGVMSYYCLRLLVLLFALDKPVGQSKRGLIMIWLMVQWAKMVLDWRKMRLIMMSVFCRSGGDHE